ncbi:MAG: hypothetical protein ACSLFF_06945 [Solirubrobacterales bacterium]
MASLALAASTAGAATTLGSDLAKPPGELDFCDTTCTSVQSALPGRVVAAPFDGVVVRWRIRTNAAGGPFALRLAAPFTGNQRTSGAVSVAVSPTAGGVTETLTRMPINIGDNIALDHDPTNTAFFKSLEPSPGAASLYFKPALAPGAPQDPLLINNDEELLFNADIEADVDRDGFGDETQDTCPNNAGTVGGCASAKPALVLSASRTQRILKLSGNVTLDRAASVEARAVVKYKVGNKQFTSRSKVVKASSAPGVKSKFAFKFTRKQRSQINSRLKLKKKLTAVITFTAKDAAGNKATATSKVRLKR